MWSKPECLKCPEEYNEKLQGLADKKFDTCTNSEGELEQKAHWIFRGLGNSSYKLDTTLERVHRVWQKEGLIESTEDRRSLQDRLLNEFKRRYHHYNVHPVSEDDDLEWLAMMRHWGAPSRLMDWTYSYHVATFFALQQADERDDADQRRNSPRCAHIWAVDLKWLRTTACKDLEKDTETKAIAEIYKRRLNGKERAALGNQLLTMQKIKGIHAITPYHLNQRLSIQQGLFLFSGDLKVPFVENLKNIPYSDVDEHIRIFEINFETPLRRQLLRRLADMNITSTTLFPGLEGYASSLNTLPPWQTPAINSTTTL